jgi:hypothetical protein
MQADVMIYVRVGNVKEVVCQLIKISDVREASMIFGSFTRWLFPVSVAWMETAK